MSSGGSSAGSNMNQHIGGDGRSSLGCIGPPRCCSIERRLQQRQQIDQQQQLQPARRTEGSSAKASTPLCRPNSSDSHPSRTPRSISNGTRKPAWESRCCLGHFQSISAVNKFPPFRLIQKPCLMAPERENEQRELALALTLNIVPQEFVPSVNCASHINWSRTKRRKATVIFSIHLFFLLLHQKTKVNKVPKRVKSLAVK